jgi:hypothetical protein
VVIATNIEKGIEKVTDFITEHEFKLDWPKAKNIGCSTKERVRLEKLIRHIIVDHREMFVEKHIMWSDLFELKIAVIFAESDGGLVNIDPFTIAALAEAQHHAKGHGSIIKPFAMVRLIGGGHMRITSLCYGPGNELWLEWSPSQGSRITTDLVCMMSICLGDNADGITSIREALKLLSQWDALADVVGESCSDCKVVRRTLADHFEVFGEMFGQSTTRPEISPRTFPEIVYSVVPMWSTGNEFRSKSDIASYLSFPKPQQLPSSVEIDSDLLHSLPRGNGDYMVDFDKSKTEWAVLYSPRLGIYYKVTAKLRGTKLDDCKDLHSALKIRKSPQEYILKDIAELQAHHRLPAAPVVEPDSNPFYSSTEHQSEELQSSPDEVDGWILDYEATDNE